MKRWIHATSTNKVYRVDIVLKDGTVEYFDTFQSEDYAHYHIALAKSSPDSVYRDSKYDDATWQITEEDIE